MAAEKITITKSLAFTAAVALVTPLAAVSWSFLNYRINENKEINDKQEIQLLATMNEIRTIGQALQHYMDTDGENTTSLRKH